MLITPAAAARQWTDRLSVMVLVSAFFGSLSGVAGATVSASGEDLPTGALVVLFASALLLLSLLLGARHGLLWSYFRGRRNRRAALGKAAGEAVAQKGGA
jgi:manganese/zinc/iron transport system permease protein